MRRWRDSAAMRISLAWSASFALGVVLLGIAIFWAMHVAFMRQMDNTLAQESQTLADDYHSGGLADLREAIADREALTVPTHPLYAVFGPGGKRIAGRLDTTLPAPGFADIRFRDPVEGMDWARGYTVGLAPGTWLVVAEDREWIERIDNTIVGVFALGFAGVAVLGTAAAFLIGLYLRNRLKGFRRSAEQVIAGRIEDRMPVGRRGDEFDDLAMVLNAMLDRIEALVGNLRQVSNDIAHDLRTPLTRLRQRLEDASGAARGTAAEESVGDALDRVDEVLSLFAGILHVSEVERGGSLPLRRLDLAALATEIAESYEPALREGGRSLSWDIGASAFVEGERNLLAQALANLVENAQAHTPTGTHVAIALETHGGEALVSVIDDGPGIAAQDRDRVRRRFERLEASRTTPGFGLGLALVDAVARRHHGRLVLSDAGPGPNPGLKATIVLPLAAAQTPTGAA